MGELAHLCRFGHFRPASRILMPLRAPVVGPGKDVNAIMSREIEVIMEFIGAICNRDSNTAVKFFTGDAVYHNMPLEPVTGPTAIREALDFFLKPASDVDWQMRNIAQVGNAVLTERVDRFTMNGKQVTLPVMGVFEFQDGRITAWRDYFDMATWTRQMQAD